MRSIIQPKKGDVFQILFMLVLLLVVAITGLITFVLTSKINQQWDDSGLLNDTAIGTQAIDTLQETAPRTTDYAIFLLFLGMNIGIIVGAVRTNFSATIIVLFIFLTLIAVMVAAGAVNIYQGMAQQPSIIAESSQLTLTNIIFSKYLPMIISLISALVLLIMYGKGGQDILT